MLRDSINRPSLRGLTLAGGLVLSLGSGCVTSHVNNTAGSPTRHENPASTSPLGGVGIEWQDAIGMTEQMVRDMLTSQDLAGRTTAPRIAIDSSKFRNESSNRIYLNMITTRLRVALNRAAKGRMRFVGYAAMTYKARDEKRTGVVDGGTLGHAAVRKAPDYQLVGLITSLDGVSDSSGAMSQIVFEMVDVETSEIVWSGMYEIRKADANDVVYR